MKKKTPKTTKMSKKRRNGERDHEEMETKEEPENREQKLKAIQKKKLAIREKKPEGSYQRALERRGRDTKRGRERETKRRGRTLLVFFSLVLSVRTHPLSASREENETLSFFSRKTQRGMLNRQVYIGKKETKAEVEIHMGRLENRTRGRTRSRDSEKAAVCGKEASSSLLPPFFFFFALILSRVFFTCTQCQAHADIYKRDPETRKHVYTRIPFVVSGESERETCVRSPKPTWTPRAKAKRTAEDRHRESQATLVKHPSEERRNGGKEKRFEFRRPSFILAVLPCDDINEEAMESIGIIRLI